MQAAQTLSGASAQTLSGSDHHHCRCQALVWGRRRRKARKPVLKKGEGTRRNEDEGNT
jgi:hypothetical protein